MRETYIDLHTHTTLSDGTYTPQQLCDMAQCANIGILALTDHNYSEDLAPLQTAYPNICFIQGAEISCLHTTSSGQETEIHVVALGFNPDNPKIKSVLTHNQPDRKPYINAILDRLRLCGIDLGNYEDLHRLYPNKRHIGRMDIARTLKDRRFVATVDQAFDIYIGSFGEKKHMCRTLCVMSPWKKLLKPLSMPAGLLYWRICIISSSTAMTASC